MKGFAAISIALAVVSVSWHPAEATTTDHYQCYAVVKGSTIEPIPVNLKDQFGRSSAAIVRAVSVCAPVNKNGSKIDDPVTHLVCYQLESPVTDVAKTVRVTNQFGDLRVNLGAAIALCVPSTKKVILR